MTTRHHEITDRAVTIACDDATVHADLNVPPDARGIVLFAHGSGSSRASPRNRAVAAELQRAHFATLLLDLLTVDEELIDATTRQHRFDIPLLSRRLVSATDWAMAEADTRGMPVGYFGASTGAAAALVAAAQRPDLVKAVVSRGGRPDLAGRVLGDVKAATLLIVGGYDEPVLDLNRDALRQLHGVAHLEIVPRATHLFEEPGAMAHVTQLATAWFDKHLASHPLHAARQTDGW